MARRESSLIDTDEEGKHIPNLEIRLPQLIAEKTGDDSGDYDYPVGEYPIPDLEDQELESVE